MIPFSFSSISIVNKSLPVNKGYFNKIPILHIAKGKYFTQLISLKPLSSVTLPRFSYSVKNNFDATSKFNSILKTIESVFCSSLDLTRFSWVFQMRLKHEYLEHFLLVLFRVFPFYSSRCFYFKYNKSLCNCLFVWRHYSHLSIFF